MNDGIANPPRAALAGAAAALLLAIAGCGAEPAATDADETPAAAAPATAAAPAGQERLTTADCATPAEGRVHFRVAQAVLAVPADRIVTVMPPDVPPTADAAQIVQRLRAATEAGAGCPEQPLDAGMIGLATAGPDPLLAGQIAVVASPAGAIGGPYGDLTRRLLQNAEQCERMEGGLIACAGAEMVGEQQRPVMYLVATEAGRTLNFGGPLSARCTMQQNQVTGCEIVDELPGGIAIRAPLRALPQSTDALAAAHRAAVEAVRSARR